MISVLIHEADVGLHYVPAVCLNERRINHFCTSGLETPISKKKQNENTFYIFQTI